jgi:hypothetical protein
MSFLSVDEVPSIMVRSSVNCSAAGSHLFGIVRRHQFRRAVTWVRSQRCARRGLNKGDEDKRGTRLEI